MRRHPAATRRQTQALAERRSEVARSLRASVPTPVVPSGRRAILLLMGFPGTGKSHCARLLAPRLGAAHVASDDLRSRLFIAASYAPRENAAVFRIVDELVELLIDEGHPVIVDATHLRATARASMAELATRRGIPLAHVLVVSEEADTLTRLDARRHERAADDRSEADAGVYAAMRTRGFEEPGHPYLTLRNGPDLAREIDRVARAVEALWSAAS